jgi:hypothetical protein
MAFKVKQILYSCAGGFCSPDDGHKKIKKNDIVLMIASNIDVEINFLSGTPFKSGTTHFVIPKGTIAAEFVAPGAKQKKYPYALTCTNPTCATRADPPEMIVVP